MKLFRTNFESLLKSVISGFIQSFIGPWKTRSIGLLSVLIGFYAASTISAYYLQEFSQRVIVVAVLCILIEIAIRYRRSLLKAKKSILLLIIDNMRIGITYAIVLEAFKLGS